MVPERPPGGYGDGMKSRSPPAVSVIIPTYNRAYCVGQTLRTVLEQSFDDYELIVVDDGSTDATRAVLEQFAPNVKCIYQKNAGAAAARNAGMKSAKGEFIAFLDSDDEWFPEKLEVQWEQLRSHATAVAHMVDAKIGDYDKYVGSLFELRGVRGEYELRPLRVRPFLDVLGTQFFTSTWMLRRSAIEKVGYFDTSLRIFEDLDFLCRMSLAGPFVVSGYVGTYMRRKAGAVGALSDLYQKSRLEALENLLSIYEKLRFEGALTIGERDYVQREIAATHLEVAATFKRAGLNIACLGAVRRAVRENHSPYALAKAGALLLLSGTVYERLRGFRNRKRKVVRRSEEEG